MEDLKKKSPTENDTAVQEPIVRDVSASQETREGIRDNDAQIDELVHTTSKLNGLLKSDTISINANLNQANHFYRFDVVEGESYRVVNDSTAAALIVYISETGDESYGAEKTQCIQVSPNHTGIFVAPHNALYIGFYNNANSVNVEISHKGYDDDVKDISQVRGVVLTRVFQVQETLAQANHFYKYDIVAGQKYTVENNSTTAGLNVYTSNTGETGYNAPKTLVAQIAAGHSQVIFPSANARYIGFYNNADDVDFTITHNGLDQWALSMQNMQQSIAAMQSTVNGLDARITASKAEAIVTSENYTDAAVLAVSPTNIMWDQLSVALQSMIPPTGGGNITNAPDGEDLTVVNSVLKFADKNATLIQYGGKNRVFLRKNIDNSGKNVLTGNMINATNTLYILQYDYDLNGATIVLGAGSSILFYGGSVKNGILNYSAGSIIPACDSFFGYNLRVVTNEPVNIAWYGAKSGSYIDNILDWLGGHTIIIPVGEYKVERSGYVLEPNTMIVGEKILNNDQTCRIKFKPLDETKGFIIGLNNNCGFKDITLWLDSETYNGDLVRVDSVFWKDLGSTALQALRAQQYYIDNVYFYTSYMSNGRDHYLATAFHIVIRDTDDNNTVLPDHVQYLSYRQHFKNVEMKYFSVGIRVDLVQNAQHSNIGVWCNSLHFFDIDMWVRNNGFVYNTPNNLRGTQGRFLISGILLQAVGEPDDGGHYPYAFYATNGHNCMLDKINAYDNSRVAYVDKGCITLGQYMCDRSDALAVGTNGCIKIPKWLDYSL